MADSTKHSGGEQSEATKSFTVPVAPKFEQPKSRAIYCFPPGTSEADKQDDIEQVNLWIESIKARRKK